MPKKPTTTSKADPCAAFPPELELDDQLIIRRLERHLAIKRYLATERPAVLARIEKLKQELALCDRPQTKGT
jgi:hypothetical protein